MEILCIFRSILIGLINHTRNIYDKDWHLLPVKYLFDNSSLPSKKPSQLREMLDIAADLSKGLVFCRVDLYNTADKVIFGEITMYPGSGFEKFSPESFDYEWGKHLDISKIKVSFKQNLYEKSYQFYKGLN